MLYDLELEGSIDKNYEDEKRLLKEVLGYNDDEVKQLISRHSQSLWEVKGSFDGECQYIYSNIVAINLTAEQVSRIVPRFNDCHLHMYVYTSDTGEPVSFHRIYQPPTKPISWDKPIVKRSNLVDVYEKVKVIDKKGAERPKPAEI